MIRRLAVVAVALLAGTIAAPAPAGAAPAHITGIALPMLPRNGGPSAPSTTVWEGTMLSSELGTAQIRVTSYQGTRVFCWSSVDSPDQRARVDITTADGSVLALDIDVDRSQANCDRRLVPSAPVLISAGPVKDRVFVSVSTGQFAGLDARGDVTLTLEPLTGAVLLGNLTVDLAA